MMSEVHRWVRHIMCCLRLLFLSLNLLNICFQGLCSTDVLFCSVFFCSACGQLLQELELSLFCHFLPAMFGVEVSAVELCLFALPLRLGGLGICNPVPLTSHLFNSPIGGNKHLARSFLVLSLLS